MADDDYSSQGSSRKWIYVALFFIALIVLVILAGGFYLNHSRITKLENAQKMAQNEKSAPTTATPIPLKDINDPAVRLALVRSYAAALNPLLNSARQKDLETVVVYINGNPKVLVTKNPDLPKDVALAVSNLKTAVKNLKVTGTIIKQNTANTSYNQGDVFNLTGTINFVADDEELGGSIFSLTDSESGDVYYLHFNDTNSANIKANMIGKEVTVGVKVTSKANEPLTFQVTKGPTLTSSVTSAPTKTLSATITPTPTP